MINQSSKAVQVFAELSPDKVIDAVESTGVLSDLRVFALNSYENRVYQIGIEEGEPIIAKFYRPERWSNEQIQEEHDFSQQLVEADIPVIPPIPDADGNTLRNYDGFRFSLYKRRGGYAPALDDMDSLYQLGQLLGRIHLVGASQDFRHRPSLDIDSFGRESADFVLQEMMPKDLKPAYQPLAEQLLDNIQAVFDRISYTPIRVHGDCHVGNILCRDGEHHFVDLDDSRMAAAMQDIWMFVTGDKFEQAKGLAELVDGYDEFYQFEPKQIALLEPLRTLRLMHHAAWLGRRWQDPAFPMAFPWFNTANYWSSHILELKEQLSALDEAPIKLF